MRCIKTSAGHPKEVGGLKMVSLLLEADEGKSCRKRDSRSEGIACPAAAAAFGFKSLPEGLKSGKGIVGFGIVSGESVGERPV